MYDFAEAYTARYGRGGAGSEALNANPDETLMTTPWPRPISGKQRGEARRGNDCS